MNALRTAEVFIRDQQVPTTFGGAGGQWVRAWGSHTLLVGGEGRYVKGKSVETPFSQGLALATTAAGGTDRRKSGFVQDTWQAGKRLTIVLGAHGDTWSSKSNQTGFSKSSQAFNPAPRLPIGSQLVTVRGAVYHGFRAPTLNELYRNFSAGNTQTRANEALGPERMTGGDPACWSETGARRRGSQVSGTVSTTPSPRSRSRARRRRSSISAPTPIECSRTASSSRETGGDERASLNAATGMTSVHYTGNTTLHGNRVPQVPSYNRAPASTTAASHGPRPRSSGSPASIRRRPEPLHAPPRDRR